MKLLKKESLEINFPILPIPNNIKDENEFEDITYIQGKSWISLKASDCKYIWDFFPVFSNEAFRYYLPAVIYISFEEAAKGCKKTVSYDCVSSCDECHGTGAKPGTQPKTCSVCGGSGRVTISQRSPFGVVQTQRACDACHGKGKIIDSPCPKCGGSGRKRRTKTVDITVPAGIKDQQILNVGGRGNAGYNGGPSGDLHVYVNVQPHPVFERRGDDVWCNLPLTFAQAALGAEVVVPTLDGKVSYQVHEGTQPGDVFKLKGKGIQRLNGRGKGDQYVRVTIEVPKNLNAKQKNLIKEFENVTNEKNYAQRNSFFEKIKRMFNE